MNDLNPSRKPAARTRSGNLLALLLPAALILALLMLFLAGGATASAQVVTNTADSGPGTLRTALADANNGAVITFAPNLSGATVTLSNTLTINTNLTIDASALPGGLQINGNGSVQIFNVASNTFVFLNSLTITNAYSTNYGGGIYNGGTLTLTNCTLSGNYATNGDGGGIYNNGTLTMTNCTLTGNSAFFGGGIYNNGTLTMTNCTLTGNSAFFGGGIFNFAGTATLNQCTLSENSADGGGGIFNNEGTATLNQCTLSENSATNGGGGIYNTYYYATLTLNQCTLSGNSATNGGGGIYNDEGGTMTLNQCTLSGNSVGPDGYFGGGGIYNYEGTATLNQCTLSGNSAGYGGGIYNENNVFGTLTLNQCTLSGNIANAGGGIYNFGTLAMNQCTLSGNVSFGYLAEGGGIFNDGVLAMANSIVGGNSGSYGADIFNYGGTLTYGDSNLVQYYYNGSRYFTGPAPNLAPLGNYGGPTQTMPPLPGSPAIGAGSVAANTFSTDQRGYPRTQNGLIDIGAVELQSPAANPPVLKNITVPAGGGAKRLQFTFTNAPAADFTVLTATNVSLALTNWTVLGEVQQVAPGQYQFTDPQPATNRVRFYRVRSP